MQGIVRIYRAMICSWEGLIAAFKGEAAFRQEILLGIVLIPLSFWIPQTVPEKIACLSSFLLVLIIELVNSAIETAVDRISEENNPLSKKAKDIASAAVLVSFINLAMVWILVVCS